MADRGVRLVWVAQPEARTVDLYRPDHVGATLGEQDAFDRIDVPPGFTCDVRAVFGLQQADQSPAAEPAGS